MNFEDIITPTSTYENEDGTTFEGVFIDADTIQNLSNGQGHRLEGYDAPEIDSIAQGVLVPGEVGADELTVQTAILANHYGFNKIINKGKDKYNRNVTALEDGGGRNWSEFLIEERLANPDRYTSEKTIDNRMMNTFVDSLNIVGKDSDPAARARLAVANAIKDVEGYQPVFGATAYNEAEFAEGKTLYSRESTNKIGELLAATTDPVEKEKLQKAYFYSKWGKNPFISVGRRRNDRTIDNQSYFQTSTSLTLGLENAVQAFYGVGELVGESAGWDWLKDKSSAGISRSEDSVRGEASVLSSYNDIEGIGDAFSWITNNVTMSLPLMGAVIGGGLVAAPLGLTGVSGMMAAATPSAVLSTGSIWNSMPDGEKSAGLAVLGGYSVGLLDRLGFTGGINGLIGSSAKSAVDRGAMREVLRDINNKVYQELIKPTMADANGVLKKALSPAQAYETLTKSSKAQLVQMADNFGQSASNNLRDLKLVKGSINQIVTSIGREAATETVQTAIEEVASVYGTSAELNPAAFKEALITSAVVGGVFGAGFDIPGIAKQNLDRKDILFKLANNPNLVSDIEQFSRDDMEAARRKDEKNPDRTNDDNISDFTRNKNNAAPGSFKEKAAAGKANRSAENTVGRMARTLKNTPGAPFVAHLLNMVNKIGLRDKDGNRNFSLTRLGGILGGININSGYHHQEYIQKLRGTLVRMMPNPDSVAQTLGTNVRTANKMMRNAVDNYVAKGIEYDGPKAKEINGLLQTYRKGQAEIKNELYRQGVDENLSDGGLDVLTVRPLSQKAIQNDKENFKAGLMTLEGSYGPMTGTLADQYIEQILSSDAQDAALSLNRGFPTASGVLSPYMSKDVLGAYRAEIEGAARLAGNNKYLGQNYSILDAALADIEAEGATKEQVEELAADIQDYLEIANGDYGAWKSPWIKNIQDNLVLLTFLRGMGFSAIASFPEGPLTMLGVPEHIAFKYIKDHAKTSANSILDYMNFLVSGIPGSPIPRKIGNQVAMSQLDALGYQSGNSSAVRQMGVEISGYKQRIAEMYAKAVGLNSITDVTRGMRGSMAADVMSHYADILAMDFESNSNMAREAYKELRDLGVNVGFLVGLHQQLMNDPDATISKEDNIKMQSQAEIASMRFIDQGMVNPLPGQIPKGYKLQKLMMFNQFQGFIANFTSKILPRIMSNIKNGSPGVTAGAVSVSLSMIAAAFLGTMLRDLLKYGEPTPYLDDYDKFRRVLFSSGLLGTGERIWSAIDPLYGPGILNPGKDSTLFSTLGHTVDGVLGEAAAWGVVEDIALASYSAVSGEGEEAVKSGLKVVPLVSSVNQLRNSITDSIF